MTKVKFLIDKPNGNLPGGEVFAFFPELMDNNHSYTMFTSYAHIGQHSACHVDYAKGCKEANYNEYCDLLKELISYGDGKQYNDLQIMNKQEIEAHRPPTIGEQCFGNAAIHWLSVNLANVINREGNIKKWFIYPKDGLRYSTK